VLDIVFKDLLSILNNNKKIVRIHIIIPLVKHTSLQELTFFHHTLQHAWHLFALALSLFASYKQKNYIYYEIGRAHV